MNTDEIFVNRRSIAKKICKAIRDNGGQLLNAGFFHERPFCDDENSYKFSSANFLRLRASNNEIRGLLKRRSNIISFHNCISAIKKFAEDNGADALTSLLTVQSWIAETKLKTKLSLFLPTFPDSVLTDIEQNSQRRINIKLPALSLG